MRRRIAIGSPHAGGKAAEDMAQSVDGAPPEVCGDTAAILLGLIPEKSDVLNVLTEAARAIRIGIV